MSDKQAATIIVPTTGDRGPLLPYSVGSILRQSVKEIEIFIIGDGVNEDTREIIAGMMREDNRIQFFDHSKHERRGEPYRHEALKYARGNIVCYLCDRDLMLKNHVERMLTALSNADLAYSHRIKFEHDGSVSYHSKFTNMGPGPLSMVAHTLEYYRNLPYGWRTTPHGKFTDYYMWEQFMDQTNCGVAALYCCSIIYLKRGTHPGLSTSERLTEICTLFKKYIDPGLSDYEQMIYKDLLTKAEFLRKLESKIRKKFLGVPVDRWLANSIKYSMRNS